jgi:hypothetical protein
MKIWIIIAAAGAIAIPLALWQAHRRGWRNGAWGW